MKFFFIMARTNNNIRKSKYSSGQFLKNLLPLPLLWSSLECQFTFILSKSSISLCCQSDYNLIIAIRGPPRYSKARLSGQDRGFASGTKCKNR